MSCWPRRRRQSCCTATHFGPIVAAMVDRRDSPPSAAVGSCCGPVHRWSRWPPAAVGSSRLAGTAAVSVATAATPHHGIDADRVAVVDRCPVGWTNDEATNAELAGLLAATHTPWSAATNGSQSAAALEIASGTSVMAVGGWSGDPVPDLQQFIDDVHAGKVSYYVEAGAGRRRPRTVRSSAAPNRSTVAHPRDRRLGRGALSRHHDRRIDGLPPELNAGVPCGRDQFAGLRRRTRSIRRSPSPTSQAPTPARADCRVAST